MAGFGVQPFGLGSPGGIPGSQSFSVGDFLGQIAAPIIAGGFGFAGQKSTNYANAAQAKQAEDFSASEAVKARSFNAGEAAVNRRFQDTESSTAYQRAVKDLKAAGLNPALAYQQGSASSPSGSTASGPSASGVSARFDSSSGAGISSAVSASNLMTAAAQRDQIRSQTGLINAQALNVGTMMAHNVAEVDARAGAHSASAVRNRVAAAAESALYPVRAQVLEADWLRGVASAAESRARTSNLGTQGELLRLSVPAAQANADAARSLFGHYVLPYLGGAKDVLDLAGKFGKVLR